MDKMQSFDNSSFRVGSLDRPFVIIVVAHFDIILVLPPAYDINVLLSSSSEVKSSRQTLLDETLHLRDHSRTRHPIPHLLR